MHSKEYFVSKLIEAVLNYDDNKVEEIALNALNVGINPVILIEEGLSVAMEQVGEMFSKGQLYLPHVLAASEAMNAGVRALLPAHEEYVPVSGFKATVMIGTIEGDIHSIGKDIVAASLQIEGYRVIDLGIDVPVEEFIEKALELSPDVVATSALMNITMVNQQVLEEKLKDTGIRDRLKTVVGGSPVSDEWALEIGADIYGADAADTVEKLNVLFCSAKESILIEDREKCRAVRIGEFASG